MPKRSDSANVIARRTRKVVEDSFKGKTGSAHPKAIIMAGPQGSGKSTKAKALLREREGQGYVYVNPDSTLMALNGGKRKLPDDNPEIFSKSQLLTEQIVDHALTNRYNVVLDTSIPAAPVLNDMKRQGYDIKFVVMTTPPELARKREVHRDLTQLNWGRVGINSAAQANTAAEIAQNLPKTISRFADSVVTCENAHAVMSCTDNTRVRPNSQGPNVSLKAKQKIIWLPRLA